MPYFVLSSTSPLLQKWLSLAHPAASPYRLYALSNAGSLLALVTYPFVFEPALTRQAQSRLWGWGFGAFVLLCGGCAWRAWRKGREPEKERIEDRRQKTEVGTREARTLQTGDLESGRRSEDRAHKEAGPAGANLALWLALPACGSVLLLATTNKLCQDVASVPFLWVLALSLYLLTFILCFDRPAWYARKAFTLLLFPLLGLVCYALFRENAMRLPGLIWIYCGNLFVCCMVCHGEVHRLRPTARHLTLFYLLIAAGGAFGGVMVGVVAPLVFCSYAELSWSLGLLGMLVTLIQVREKTAWTILSLRWPAWPFPAAGTAALAVALLLQIRRSSLGAVSRSRDFYGTLRVDEVCADEPAYHGYKLYHGNISHGAQFVDPVKARVPTTYFNELSGVGLAMNHFPRQTNRNVGVVGLGVGTLAAYGRPGDRFRFYEINPAVRDLARTRFTYLRKSEAHVDVVMRDARLSLESELPQNFDLLVLDAFTSDAIPIHLLTQEAFAIYLRHLKPDGAIAVHISNRHVDLFPVMLGVVEHFGLRMVYIPWTAKPMPRGLASSKWVLMTRNLEFLQSKPILSSARQPPLATSTNAIVWTDEYASLFRILR